MGKPSIFSKEYEKKMQRHKRNKVILIVACLMVAVLVVVYIRGAFRDVVKETSKVKNNIVSENKQTKNNADSQKSSQPNTQTKSKDAASQNSYKIKLSSGKDVSLIYQGKGNDKVFKADSSGTYDVSPSGKNALLFDDKSQSILLVDANGNKQDITNPQYVSTTGTVIAKDSQLTNNPGYVWCSSPKFIDDNNIAYVSQLPWIGKTTKYMWIESLQNKNHVMVQNIEGEDIKFQGISEKGLTAIVDGKTVYLTASGSVTQ
ncbi:hypothetical protein [Clostridium ljungdahlii]|uniref:Secreted protein n=1 Tax=Clostridium ljungdahlii TaxID=1538 RepID=A0A162KP02_9CLOT|nr:hypothetical protein [Clostridium ljungdahlii]OAA84902.1 hypothetical protein WY13_02805 [Clostridium ljungdahlii]